MVQITKTKIEKSRKKSCFSFCQVRNRKKRQNSRRILYFFPVSYLPKTKAGFFSIFFDFRFCNLYSTRTDLSKHALFYTTFSLRGVSDHLILSRYFFSNIVANIVTNVHNVYICNYILMVCKFFFTYTALLFNLLHCWFE